MISLFLRSFLIMSLVWPFGGGNEAEESKIKKTSLDVPGAEELQNFEVMRISLGSGIKEFTVSADAPFQVLDGKKRRLFGGPKIGAMRVTPTENGVRIGSENFKDTPLTIESETGSLKLDGKSYRRTLLIWRDERGLLVVNEILLEDYLKGVLPAETSPSWPLEALKAQAIASRTYALFKAIENKDKKFAMSKDVLSQVYAGKGAEHAATSRAVDETRGQVLLHKGKLFPAYFHSTCGGKTTRADYIWNVEPHQSLKGVECQFCWSSKHYRWKASLTAAEIGKKLKARGFQIGKIKDIQISKVDQSGRARSFLVVTDSGKREFQSNDFRLWVDPMKFKSTLITAVDKNGGSFSFEGKGWGHGVGICQFGMRQLAQLGYTHGQILDYYYPDSKVVSLWGNKGIKGKLSKLQDAVENFEI